MSYSAMLAYMTCKTMDDETNTVITPGQDVDSKPSTQEVQQDKQAVLRYAQTIPSKYQQAYFKAANGESSPRAVIKAKCLDCVNYEDPVGRIKSCKVTICPSWRLRPYQK